MIVDETGRQVSVPGEPQPYLSVVLSPGGRRVAPDGAFSPDGHLIAYSSNTSGR